MDAGAWAEPGLPPTSRASSCTSTSCTAVASGRPGAAPTAAMLARGLASTAPRRTHGAGRTHVGTGRTGRCGPDSTTAPLAAAGGTLGRLGAGQPGTPTWPG